MTSDLAPGDDWPYHRRGYRLQTNPDGEVWWQVYQGTQRLYVEPTPDDLVDDLLSLKQLGGRVRITEGNSVITRVEDGDDYRDVFVGKLSLNGSLVPEGEPEYSVPFEPTGLSSGDVWPSVYDGAKYSFSGERVWWTNPTTHRRHRVETDLPEDVLSTLSRLKPTGGSFVVTPTNDVVTLVEDAPDPERAKSQLRELPRVVKNVILMRRERGVEMVPVYVGSVHETPLEVSEPASVTDPLSDEEQAALESWAGSLGKTTKTDAANHSATRDPVDDDPETWNV